MEVSWLKRAQPVNWLTNNTNVIIGTTNWFSFMNLDVIIDASWFCMCIAYIIVHILEFVQFFAIKVAWFDNCGTGGPPQWGLCACRRRDIRRGQMLVPLHAIFSNCVAVMPAGIGKGWYVCMAQKFPLFFPLTAWYLIILAGTGQHGQMLETVAIKAFWH